MKTINIHSILLTLLLSSCGPIISYLRHPTNFYVYADKKLTSPSRQDKSEFKSVKKETYFRQGGHITYDYFKITDKLVFPEDSVLFKNSVKEIIYTRLTDIKVDSVVFGRCTHYTENQIIQGSKEFAQTDGKIFTNKSGHVFFRRFGASIFPGLSGTIINIDTYVHLKF